MTDETTYDETNPHTFSADGRHILRRGTDLRARQKSCSTVSATAPSWCPIRRWPPSWCVPPRSNSTDRPSITSSDRARRWPRSGGSSRSTTGTTSGSIPRRCVPCDSRAISTKGLYLPQPVRLRLAGAARGDPLAAAHAARKPEGDGAHRREHGRRVALFQHAQRRRSVVPRRRAACLADGARRYDPPFALPLRGARGEENPQHGGNSTR